MFTIKFIRSHFKYILFDEKVKGNNVLDNEIKVITSSDTLDFKKLELTNSKSEENNCNFIL